MLDAARNRRAYPDAVLVLDPARSIIKKFGGEANVAKITGRHITRVRRWTFPKGKNGSDGIIPMPEALKLIAYHKSSGMGDLSMDAFVAVENKLSRHDLDFLARIMDGQTTLQAGRGTSMDAKTAKDTESRLKSHPLISEEAWTLIEKRRAKKADLRRKLRESRR